MINNIFQYSMRNNKPISIFSNIDSTNLFSCGIIQAYDERWVIINSISTHGNYDGFLLVLKKNIYKCIQSDMYCNKILRLYSINKQDHKKIPVVTNDLLINLMAFSSQNHKIISIELCNSNEFDICGLVEKIDNDSVTIKQYNEYGELDGICVVSIDEITRVSCDGEDESALGLLINVEV